MVNGGRYEMSKRISSIGRAEDHPEASKPRSKARSMTRELDEYECIRVDVAVAFFKYVNIFNLLERNIVLCISGLGKGCDRAAVQAQLSGLTMHGKMEVLNRLIAKGGFEARDGVQKAFDEWFLFASKAKAARNSYVHGYWEINPSSVEPIRFTPNQWSSDSSTNTESMTMDEFLDMMGEMDRVFEGFGKLREKYGI